MQEADQELCRGRDWVSVHITMDSVNEFGYKTNS